MSDDQDAEQPRPPVSIELLKWISREYFGKLSFIYQRTGSIHLQRSDMNGSSYHVLDHPPTPLEFARLVHLSRPVVIKGTVVVHIWVAPERLTCCILGAEFPALTKWTDDYLVQKMGDQCVSVAGTPNGYDLIIHDCVSEA